MAVYRTPGVYVEEISTLPPSVAEVSTAIPAFLGYTEKGPAIARIGTMLDYEQTFGGPKPTGFTVQTTTDATGATTLDIAPADKDAVPDRLLHYAVSHYFKNGGGPCWILSLGGYAAPLAKADFLTALDRLALEDEPTLIVPTDAVLLQAADYFEVAQAALAQCSRLKDRFTILDVLGGDVAGFRTGIGTDALSYGAAYHPYLQTSLSFAYAEGGVQVRPAAASGAPRELAVPAAAPGITVAFTGPDSAAPKLALVDGDGTKDLAFAIAQSTLTVTNTAGRTGRQVADAWAAWKGTNPAQGFDIRATGDGSATLPATAAGGVEIPKPGAGQQRTLAELKTGQTALYNQVKEALARQRVTLPPSAAIAGVYARVDRDRGVWKAPANVSLSAVIAADAKMTDADQEALNVDPTAGKSINAIRDFTGKGTLVWGARTLAGNDNEWRYVPVRRLFVNVEESAKKASAFAVFEPNDATTWLKVRGMIESYLYGLWERGALAGSTPDAAYYVHVGLGRTMTPQDVLEGRMIVEIGLAAVRPAEFVVLRFMHRLQQA